MNRLLVANRSEIACRVFQACKELGIETVAIFAPGDEEARHITYADHVYPVKSYLDIESVIEAAKKSKATLIHPGYGFLSERPAFAKAVEKAGIKFLGPRAETMEALGEKIAAKELAEKQKVPTLPWAKVPDGSLEAVKKAAKKVGYPLLLKASAGGGGKGMRKVFDESELKEAAESASSEAKNAFGDGTLFLERFLDKPRHIEVQVFGDGNGNAVHFFERECSLQRRHQKVWEEAGAFSLPEKTRKELCECAVRLAKSVKYRSAGTLEFLVDAKNNFYFLEMNTRLQVEHPVTECLTGKDLVHLQIAHALDAKKKLPLQSEITARGHAIEVRVYAEDPAQDFRPTPGTVHGLRWPSGNGIRVESGIEEGQTIGTGFDSMLAKVITFGETREMALQRMRFALSETAVFGMGTNLPFLAALANHPHVEKNAVDITWIERNLSSLVPELSENSQNMLSEILEKGHGLKIQTSSAATSSNQPSPWFSR